MFDLIRDICPILTLYSRVLALKHHEDNNMECKYGFQEKSAFTDAL
jgi:hypothetical protein